MEQYRGALFGRFMESGCFPQFKYFNGSENKGTVSHPITKLLFMEHPCREVFIHVNIALYLIIR